MKRIWTVEKAKQVLSGKVEFAGEKRPFVGRVKKDESLSLRECGAFDYLITAPKKEDKNDNAA
jgi:hypothetical protein